MTVYALGCAVALYWSRGTVWDRDRIAAIFLWPFTVALYVCFLFGVAFFNVGNWR